MNITVIRLFLFLFLQILILTMADIVQRKQGLFVVILHELNEMVTWSRLRESHKLDDLLKIDHINITHLINFQFYGKITVGRPKQSFRVIFDTSTADFWVISSKNKNQMGDIYHKVSFCVHKKYMSHKSNTYRLVRFQHMIKYRSGILTGILGKDRVSLGGRRIEGQTFTQSVRESRVPFAYMKTDGVFGLAYQNIAHANITPPFYNMITQGIAEEPKFAFYFPRNVNSRRIKNSTKNSPVIIFGGTDTTRYEGPITYTPVTKQGYWQFKLDAIVISGTQTSMSTNQAIFDTGTGLIFGPTEDIHKINNLLGTTLLANGMYSIDCDDVHKLPEIKFFIGGTSFEILPKDYILKMKSVIKITCVSAFYDINTYNQYKTMKNNTIWALGNVFISRFYTEFDLGRNRIGIAQLKDL